MQPFRRDVLSKHELEKVVRKKDPLKDARRQGSSRENGRAQTVRPKKCGCRKLVSINAAYRGNQLQT